MTHCNNGATISIVATHKAFAALDAERQAALEADLLALLRQADTGGSRGLLVPGEYLETVIVK